MSPMALLLRLAVALLLVGLWCPPLFAGEETLRGRVVKVFDGDTMEVAGVGRIRLLGIDTPEHEASERDDYLLRRGVAPARLRAVAVAAGARSRALCAGREVTLVVGERDRHGRRLADVTLPDGRLLNRLLLDEGLAVVYRRFDFPRKNEYLGAEAAARRHRVGLWQ